MAPPERIAERLEEHNHDAAALVSIPSYFGRKREEDELRQRELRFKNILAAMPLPVLIVGDGDELLYANSHANSLFKIEQGSSIAEAELFVNNTSYSEVVNAARGGKRLHSEEHEMQDHAREGFSALVSAHALVLPDGVRGVAVTALDVTDYKRAQASLRQSERLATVGTLTAGVAHEVNNPLAYTIANLERLSEALDGDTPLEEVRELLRRSVDNALDGSHRVRRIVRDLRRLSRPDEADEEEKTEVVELEEVLEKAVLLSEMTWRRRATLVRNLSESAAVLANHSRLVQVFVNMIVNAAHAIEEGAASKNTIIVSTVVRSDQWIEITISDSGRGLTPDQQARVFDPFFTTKAVGEGTGLGLSISKSMIERLGGRISIESKPGEGTTITVLLRKATQEPLVAPPHKHAAEAADLSGLRILLVDDEPALTEVLSDMLVGADVIVESSGRAALETLRSVSVDLVLCDLMMPDVTGIELYQQCSDDVRPRIVFMTGGVYTEDATAFLKSVENPCLEKPIDLAELRAALSQHSTWLAQTR